MVKTEVKYLMDTTRDIVVAKLSQSAPNYSDKDTGEAIAGMYEAIYNKLNDIYKAGISGSSNE